LHDFFLIDNSVLNLHNLSTLIKLDNTIHNVNNFFNYYLCYFYNLKLKLYILTYNTIEQIKFNSIDSIVLNANWLERESSEMYGIFFYSKKDTRKLLLDYSRAEFPLRRDFSSEGYMDCFYSIFDNDVIYVTNEVVEL